MSKIVATAGAWLVVCLFPQVVFAQSSVAGSAQDQTGGVLPHARIELVSGAATVKTTETDEAGQFRFEAIPPGQYELRATFPGFKPSSTRVRVTSRPLTDVKLVLALAAFNEVVTVDTGEHRIGLEAAHNAGAITVDQELLAGVPVMDQDYLSVVSRFLDPGSLGGVTIVVNGMEVSAARVSPSTVQQIRVNQDPYSAEYGRPGRGRIEILTKPGGQQFHGEVNFIGRDARLDARNAFAATKPAEQKHVVEGNVSGPVGHGGKTSFVFSANYQTDDQQAVVYASVPSGIVRDVVPQPNSQGLVSLNITHQIGDKTLISINPTYQYEASDNRGVGGLTLATAGTDFRHHEQQVRFTHQTALRPTLVSQVQILIGHEREPTTSVSPDRGIVVADAFTGGGGQGDLVRTETHMQMNASLLWSGKRHVVQAGFQVPDWSRRGFFDRTNFGGTFYFSSLDAYVLGRPYAFTEQRGNGDLALLEKQIGAFIKDEWHVRPNVSLSFGLRYDWQNYFHDDDNWSPRASVAYAPRGSQKTIIRGGAGVFTDRSGPVIVAELLHSERGDLSRYVVTNPPYPDPSIAIGAGEPRSLTQLAPGVQIPRTGQFGASVDRQVRKGLTLSVGYTGARGYHLFRSRDVNAPPPPLYLDRPSPAFGAIRQIESDGRQTTDSLQLTLRGQMTRWFSGQTQYTLSRGLNDTNGLGFYPANDYDLTGEWARADFDRRHRLVLLGRVTPGKVIDLGVGLTMNSAGPYTELVGADLYSNGRGRARPVGIARNTLAAAGFSQLDLRVSKDIRMGHGKESPALSLALDAFNVLNRINYGSFVGTIGSPLFGQPISARPPRQLQLGARVSF